MSKLEELIELTTLWELKKVELVRIKKEYQNFTGKLVVISDLHVPFIEKSLFKEFIKREKKEADVLVIAGDFVNFDIFSRFITGDKTRADEEIKIAKEYIEELCSFKIPIIYLTANHELRLDKFLLRTMSVEQVKSIINLGLNLKTFFNYKNLKIVNNWFIEIGDIIIAHPEDNSSVYGKTLDNIREFFSERIKDFRAIIIGHTHKQSKFFIKRKLCIENGCMSKILDYSLDSRFNRYKKDIQYKGYSYSFLKNGKCDFNRTDFVNLAQDDYLF
jgi:predicted phosphodiesterase